MAGGERVEILPKARTPERSQSPSRRYGLGVSSGGRWAVLGTGTVATKFVHDMRAHCRDTTVIVTGSRSVPRAQAFADACDAGVGVSYADAVAHTDVEMVYIATPPESHATLAELALDAGKAVLVEKPFTTSAESATQLVERARSQQAFLMEAMWTRFLPVLTDVQSAVAEGAVGDVRAVEVAVGWAGAPGSALLDLGPYVVSLALWLLGPPLTIDARGTRVDGHDRTTALQLGYPDAVATLRCSLEAQLANQLIVEGTAGCIVVNSLLRPQSYRIQAAHPARGSSVRQSRARRVIEVLDPVRDIVRGARPGRMRPIHGIGYHYEAAEVMRCVRAGMVESPVMPLADSIEAMRIIDTARALIAAQ
jgi:predicted dehydrogenase